jgi:hypothetical protein
VVHCAPFYWSRRGNTCSLLSDSDGKIPSHAEGSSVREKVTPSHTTGRAEPATAAAQKHSLGHTGRKFARSTASGTHWRVGPPGGTSRAGGPHDRSHRGSDIPCKMPSPAASPLASSSVS